MLLLCLLLPRQQLLLYQLLLLLMLWHVLLDLLLSLLLLLLLLLLLQDMMLEHTRMLHVLLEHMWVLHVLDAARLHGLVTAELHRLPVCSWHRLAADLQGVPTTTTHTGRLHRGLAAELQGVATTSHLLESGLLAAELQGMAVGHLLGNWLRAEWELGNGLAMHLQGVTPYRCLHLPGPGGLQVLACRGRSRRDALHKLGPELHC
jgi:hypothetical protein